MARYCSVCGRELKKTEGTMGPVCERKHHPRTRRSRRMTKKAQMRLLVKNDIFGGE